MKEINNEYKECRLCPRNCGAARTEGKNGVCLVTDRLKVARAALHFWEEPCISGTNGSGAVFFSGCAMHCVYCQNEDIAQGLTGKEISGERLAEIFLELQEKKANNINLVTPGQYLPHIIRAVEEARRQGLILPIIYNTGGYEKVEVLKRLEGIVDVWLPDFKYFDPALAARYSKAPDYPQVVKAAIAEMVRQQPKAFFYPEKSSGRPMVDSTKQTAESGTIAGKSIDEQTKSCFEPGPLSEECEDGWLIARGVIVRQLLLPGGLQDSKRIVKYLYQTYGDQIYLSLMSQFTPLPHVAAYPELNRKVTEEEYEEYVDYAIELGVENGFIQEGDVAEESFIPAFDCEGV